MNETRNHYSCFSNYAILFCAILCCTFSCRKASNEDQYNNAAVQTDSVDLLINQAQKSTYPTDDRRRYLKRAYSLVNSGKEDTAVLLQLSKIQWTFMNLQDSLQFRRSNRQTRELALKFNDSVRVGNTYWDLGTFFNGVNLKDSAFFYLNKAQKLFQSVGYERRAGITLYDIARLQSRVKDYTASESNAIRAVELLKPIDDYVMLYRCYNLLGIVAKDLKNYDKALEQFEIANNYLDKLDRNDNVKLEIFNNVGNVYRNLGDYETAILNYEKALGVEGLEQNSPKSFARALNNLAYTKFLSGNFTGVEDDFKKALSIREKENHLEGLSGSNYNLAEYYLSQNDIVQAKVHALEAKKFSELSNNNDRLLETLVLLTKIEPKNAAIYSQQYFKLNDSLLFEERQIHNKFIRIQFETGEVEAENLVLARQMQIWIGIAVGLFLLALSVFIIVNQRIKNQKLRFQQQQQEANNEIFTLMLAQNQKIEEGKKSEQKRISEELHDGVLGEMNGARMMLMGLNKKSDEDAIAMRSTAISKLQEVQEEIRSISHELSDAAYQKFHNFIISIQELMESVGNSSNLQYSFTYNEEIDWDNLTADIKINLYRIVQESLMNCVKHAEAKNISLDFNAEEEMLIVFVEDDGKGFDPMKGKKGIGHKNISSRVDKINGSWSVNSDEGEGTLVNIKIPMVYSQSTIRQELVSLNK